MALSLPAGLDYSFGAALQEPDNVHEVRMEGSISVRSQSTPWADRQIWSVNWKQVTRDEKEALRAVFKASAGSAAISFTPPQETVAILVLAKGPQYRHTGYDNWDVSVTFEQTFMDGA